MKLTYRGVDYDYTPNSVPVMGDPIGVGVYRGKSITFRAMAELPGQPEADLTWRGVAYRSGITPAIAKPAEVLGAEIAPAVASNPATTVEIAASGVEVPTIPIVDRARNLFIRRHQRSRKREQGMMVRLAAEVGIPIEDAAHYESHVQGKLPHDFSAYDRSSTAMS